MSNHILSGSVTRSPNEATTKKVIGDDKIKLPTEYSISGWFRWTPIKD